MSADPVLRHIFRTQAGRLWRQFLPLWAEWMATADAAALQRLRYLVHTLKGSALGVDERALAQACHDLESAWDAPAPQVAAQAAWMRLHPLWQAQVEQGTVLDGAHVLVELEQAVLAFFTRTQEQLGIPATLTCRLTSSWCAEQALLWDVLPHLLRNALTHGREPEATRLAAGKSAVMRVIVRGCDGARGLRLLVADDGAGQRRARTEADLWAGRGLGVAAVRAAVGERGRLQWRGRAGYGGVARIFICK